jgi:hypothetical protein
VQDLGVQMPMGICKKNVVSLMKKRGIGPVWTALLLSLRAKTRVWGLSNMTLLDNGLSPSCGFK